MHFTDERMHKWLANEKEISPQFAATLRLEMEARSQPYWDTSTWPPHCKQY